ncbi:MAG: GNAT family N-acetyltransferase [Myxococcota bacterium]
MKPPSDRRFGPDYAEDFEADRTRLRLRPVRPEDAALLREGFARLSPESRYRRFFTAKNELTDAELRYLTDVDGEDHFALALGTLDEAGNVVEGVGIGRFIRLRDEPDVAEPALAVVDSMQGHGLGRLLMLRLIAAATERGIRRFRCDFLADNAAVRKLFEEVVDDVAFSSDGSVATATMELPHVEPDHPAAEPSPKSAVARWLGLAAARLVQLRHELQAAIHDD